MENDSLVHLNGKTCVALLKACTKLKNLEKGIMIHSEIERRSLQEKNVFVGSTLVDMYAKCGFVAKAKHVFDKLPVRDVVSWNALITGYANYGLGEEVLGFFGEMQLEGVSPNAVTFICSLKASYSTQVIDKGLEIHGEIERKGFFERSPLVGSALVDMYVKYGCIAEARQVFQKLPIRDVFSWTTLIAGYAESGHCKKALECFEEMQSEGVSPDAFTFVYSLRACGSLKATDKGQEIHEDIENRGLHKDLFVGSALVDFYAKCGFCDKARQVFVDNLPARDTALWNALIKGYIEHGKGEEALKCFGCMQGEGIPLDALTYVYSLKACGSTRAKDKGQEIHAEIERLGFLGKDIVTGSALVDMYAKCGLLTKAQSVFNKILARDVVLWNALLAGYVEHGHGEEVFEHFEEMQEEGVFPDSVTFICSLKACGTVGAIDKGVELHAEIERKQLLEDLVVGNSLIGMYAEWGFFGKAQEVFDNLPVRDIVSWNTMITGYAECNDGVEALKLFGRMQNEGLSPDVITFVCTLTVCGNAGAVDIGQGIHAYIERLNLLERSSFVGSALVSMYAKCGLLLKARQVFDNLFVQDIPSWNTLIVGYGEHGHGEEALKLFEEMEHKGISPNAITYMCTLKVCGILKAIDKGQEIHAEITSKGSLEKGLLIGNALIDMYAKCGSLMKAKDMLDNLVVRDVVSWTSVIGGYADCGHGEEALQCFDRMQFEGVFPNAVTLICCLQACGSVGAMNRGNELHAEIERKGLLESDPMVSSTLVDMYSRCGSPILAQQVFDKLPARGVVSWNALISGYAQIGESEIVFSTFERMIGEGLKPDQVTFVIVLNACSRTSLLDKSQTYFEAMSNDHGLFPMPEHHSCMVDLFGRAGLLDKVVAMIKKMPVSSNLVMWHAVLGACRNWGNVELGVQAFKYAMTLDKVDSAAYVLMSHIYAGSGMHKEVTHLSCC